jgi:hypothetical protein
VKHLATEKHETVIATFVVRGEYTLSSTSVSVAYNPKVSLSQTKQRRHYLIILDNPFFFLPRTLSFNMAGEGQEDSSNGYSTGCASSTDAMEADNTKEVEKAMRNKLIEQEEKAVKRARIVVILVLLISATAVSASTYLFAKQSDLESFKLAVSVKCATKPRQTSAKKDNDSHFLLYLSFVLLFEQYDIHLQFKGYANDIITLVQFDVQYNCALMQQVSAATTIAARLNGETFPFVTQPQFEIPAGYADGMGGIMGVMYAPRILPSQKEAWEAYSVKKAPGWLEESFRLKIAHPSHRDAVHGTIQDHEHDRRRRRRRQLQDNDDEPQNISSFIYKWEDGVQVPETVTPGQVLYPVWQTSPPDLIPINNNLLSDARVLSLYNTMIASNQSVISGHLQIFDIWDFMFDPEEKVQKTDPHAFLMEPVYGTFEAPDSGRTPELVGILLGLTSWKNIMDRLIPEGVNGVICVVDGRCGTSFTYELNGPKSKFLGVGDLHDPDYSYLQQTVQLELYVNDVEGLCVHQMVSTFSVGRWRFVRGFLLSGTLFFRLLRISCSHHVSILAALFFVLHIAARLSFGQASSCLRYQAAHHLHQCHSRRICHDGGPFVCL